MADLAIYHLILCVAVLVGGIVLFAIAWLAGLLFYPILVGGPGLIIGAILDLLFSTSPVFAYAGAALGGVTGVVLTTRLLRQKDRDRHGGQLLPFSYRAFLPEQFKRQNGDQNRTLR